jgi:hypothetical protein
MKKAMVLGVVLVLSLAVGCAGLQTVKNFICNPTAAEQAEAAQWLVAFDAVQAVAASFYPAADAIKASAMMTTLAAGGCFLVDELAAALALLQEAQAQQATDKGLKAMPIPVSQQFPALWAVVARQ